jgi:hypothetical protein
VITLFCDFSSGWKLPDGRMVYTAAWEPGVERGDIVRIADGEEVRNVATVSGVLDRGFGLFCEVIVEELK